MSNRVLATITIIFLFGMGCFGNGCKSNPDILADYIKVWGVTKYFNIPGNTKCINMDSIFSVHVEKLLSNSNKRRYNKVITELIGFCDGALFQKPVSYMDIDPTSIVFSADFSWIERSNLLNNKNILFLKQIVTTELQDSNCFVAQYENNHQVYFLNETNTLKPYPSVETRILSLAKYWNMVYYFYAYRDLLPVDWSLILPHYIRKVINCRNSEDYHLTMLELSVLLEDGHVNTTSFILDLFWGIYRIPVQVSNYGNKAIVTTCFQTENYENPFKIGDEVISVDGEVFYSGFHKLKHLIPGSNRTRKLYNYCRLFTRVKDNKTVSAQVLRGAELIDIECLPLHFQDSGSREGSHYYKHPPFAFLNDSLGYIDLSQIEENELGSVFSELISTKYLIVDLRKYPNLVLDSLANYLFLEPEIFSNWYSPNLKRPGSFTSRKPIEIGRTNSKAYGGTIFIMVNSGSQSRAEFFTMALQKTKNNLTIGSQTSGADGDVTKIQLPGSIYTSFSGLGICYPNGDQTQKNGVRIDLEFLPKGSYVSEYRDEELEFVIDQILNKRFVVDD